MQELELVEPDLDEIERMKKASDVRSGSGAITHLYLSAQDELLRDVSIKAFPSLDELELVAVFEESSEQEPGESERRFQRELNQRYNSGEIDFKEYLRQSHHVEEDNFESDMFVTDAEIHGLEDYRSIVREVENYLNSRDDFITTQTRLVGNTDFESVERAYNAMDETLGFRVNFLYRADQETVDRFWNEMRYEDYRDGERTGLPGSVSLGNEPFGDGTRFMVFYEGQDQFEIDRPGIEEDMKEK